MRPANWAAPYVSPYPDDARPPDAHLPLRAGAPEFARNTARPDPFYSGMWPTTTAYAWERELDARLLASSMPGRTHIPMMSHEKAWSIIRDNLSDALAIVSVIGSYRTLTFHQVSALVRREPRDSFKKLMHALFCGGVVDRGVHTPSLMYGAQIDHYSLFAYHLSPSGEWQAPLFRMTSVPERWATTCGNPLTMGGQYDRHNIMTSELLLRAAAHLPVTIAGEAQSFMTIVAGESTVKGAKRGDGVIIRDDDYVFCLETTASISHTLDEKILPWAQALRNAPDGRMVIFVEALPPSQTKTNFGQFKHKVGRILSKQLSGRWNQPVVSRICVASWRQWMNPGPTRDFERLAVSRFDTSTQQWEEIDLLGENRIENTQPSTHIHRSIQSTFVTPVWTRTNPLPLWAHIVADKPVPFTPVSHVNPPPRLAPYRPTEADVQGVRDQASRTLRMTKEGVS